MSLGSHLRWQMGHSTLGKHAGRKRKRSCIVNECVKRWRPCFIASKSQDAGSLSTMALYLEAAEGCRFSVGEKVSNIAFALVLTCGKPVLVFTAALATAAAFLASTLFFTTSSCLSCLARALALASFAAVTAAAATEVSKAANNFDSRKLSLLLRCCSSHHHCRLAFLQERMC